MIAGMLTSPVVITKAKTPPISASGRFSKITPDSFTLRNSLYSNRKNDYNTDKRSQRQRPGWQPAHFQTVRHTRYE